ncbi:glycoside hydrolase family 76 protein [Carboxylicivirga caseinilyticus]|uniref:glycoside hydrolase family 76 protein n=1 Tax=Carboxylicivirga caseinilyticus TaxID=3417572 RepID=UPI003D32CAED|nr:alpha-1,6-mannanase [Marinilabiliaceae bacterium A049]
MRLIILSVVLLGCLMACSDNKQINSKRATDTLDSIYVHYSVEESILLKEHYPFDKDYSATYLAAEDQNSGSERYAYLWPFSGTLSALSAIMELSEESKYNEILNDKVLKGLEKYFDTSRLPYGYSSYINEALPSDRFYDDNIWLGIDFVDLYLLTGSSEYLSKAKLIWKFVESGEDEILGGGIYWCEQKKASKNTCSNAPASVLALKLYQATDNQYFLIKGKDLYSWTKQNLQDEEDALYFDNISTEGHVSKAKYAYNSGQMLQSAAIQYNLTGDSLFLTEAQRIASACFDQFFYEFVTSDQEKIRLLKNRDIWFSAVMLRGFIELYHIDGNPKYINAFKKSLDMAWEKGRDVHGLFGDDLIKVSKGKKWLLTQAAMVEMYARLAKI